VTALEGRHLPHWMSLMLGQDQPLAWRFSSAQRGTANNIIGLFGLYLKKKEATGQMHQHLTDHQPTIDKIVSQPRLPNCVHSVVSLAQKTNKIRGSSCQNLLFRG